MVVLVTLQITFDTLYYIDVVVDYEGNIYDPIEQFMTCSNRCSIK